MEQETLEKVICQYLDKGFGSMNKNDFEVWIFHYLMQKWPKDKTSYEISMELRIPESKVKRLRYEAELKYPSVDDDARRKILADAIRKAKIREAKGQITFAIPDKMLRSYLEDLLAKDGRFYDSSFMSNIIVMGASDFLYVLDKVYVEEKVWKEILDKAKHELGERKTLPKTFREIAQELGMGFCSNFLGKVVGKASDNLVDYIKETVMDYLRNKD